MKQQSNLKKTALAHSDIDGELSQWQKDIIDKNLKEIADDPLCLRPIEELLEELDEEDRNTP